MSEKIRILFLTTASEATARLRLDQEAREIQQHIALGSSRDSFESTVSLVATINDLQSVLLKHKPHIVHFSDLDTKTEGIILADTSGQPRLISENDLVKLFRTLRDSTRIVLFNARYDKPYAQELSTEIDYTIVMNRLPGDETTSLFASAFYRGLTFGQGVQEAFNLALVQSEFKQSSEAKIPELWLRAGVDQTEPFLFQLRRAGLKRLRSSVSLWMSGQAKAEDRAIIQRGVFEGRIIFDPVDPDLLIEAESEESLQITDDSYQVRIRLNTKEYIQVMEQLFPAPPGIAPPFTLLPFIGRENALEDIKQLLAKAKDSTGKNKVVAVRGWPGVGKTTLVGRIGRDPDVTKMFPDGILWTFLGQKPNLLSEMARWGRALGTDEILRAPTLKEATARLASLLRSRRMLLIVDDVWDTAHAVPFTQVIGEQCALMVTSRMTMVADELTTDEERTYALPVLTEEDALRLLGILVPSVVEQNQDECRELIRDLESLPLAIHVAGSSLKSEAKLGWGVSDLIREIRGEARVIEELAPKDRIEGDRIPTVSALLNKSTDMLDEFTRDCFAYLGVFAPKPATFDLAAMKAVWEVEDARPIVRKLVGYGLLEPVGSGRFQMHRILVDHARSLADA